MCNLVRHNVAQYKKIQHECRLLCNLESTYGFVSQRFSSLRDWVAVGFVIEDVKVSIALYVNIELMHMK